jgi:hypothetical protein
MSEELCTKKLAIDDILNMKIVPDAKWDSTPIPVTLKSAKKFNYNGDFDEIEVSDLGIVTAGPIFSAGSCDNFALEYHLKIQYEPVPSASGDAATFKVTNAFLDVVLGKFTPETATDPV